MPPDYIRHNKHKPSSEDKVDVLMKEIYSNKTLKRELDYALDQGSKIVAIKRLRTVCENLWCPTGEYKIKYNLRNYKDTIDLYETRFIVHNKKREKLDTIIPWWRVRLHHGMVTFNCLAFTAMLRLHEVV